jgi:PRD1 phage membrane DNA delivery
MSGAMATGAAIITAIIGLAIIAVLVSKQSNTTGVIQAGASGLGTILGAAVSPVTGSNVGGAGTGGLLSNSAGIWT